MEKEIRRALISVFHKDGLADILALLHQAGVEFVSTGGTSSFIESLGYPCVAVEDLTKYPSMLGGRVKTLHPAIQGGILARRSHATDQQEVAEYGLSLIDLVIVDLYPFEATVASGASEEDIIEKIDIGGISLIRGAAKNFEDVVIIPSQADYATLYDILKAQGAKTSLEQRRHFARRAFAVSSGYDAAIFRYFDAEDSSALRLTADHGKVLRYGENPHQKGVFYGDLGRYFTQLHGKELSYNNLQDIEAAVALVQDFSEPTFAILKHNNACGCASRPTLLEAWTAALAGDPVSAFGGVLVANRPIDLATAREIDKLFMEVLVAPAYEEGALEVLQSKKNRILLEQHQPIESNWSYRSMLGGVLAQETDRAVETKAEMKPVTKVVPTEGELEDLVFATKLVKHSKSNAIVLAKGGQLIASGVGQTSRVDALKQAIEKARHFGFELQGAVLASDAFFPFDDCVTLAAEAGITAIAQPGGSVRDADSIAAADAHGIAMVMTGVRHFKH
ncbi:bifunctional phosphoribosylaminoimidazolecarboxamide formyltransferase/IMP cyclohydrolase [Porphyromonas sp. oral taxon 275]|uniref:bifunctional phosphoribosylaminoimidazolecarboxamide formyltransferase/IMP cyclohydrolase n=1 Tax=Porphyromonas sp. oral taxon 275 TaxID=712435 RepID=UPI001BA852ED|nr:bifunctional phosphoribosylaminoimidazolecarboxamide formyltransferase/IMP cyclohydrolase [Porphyromonas sp. oral taxon 275]QUB42930.1 bifunctional phosphoribosylaminoimidazolecarboxamide formyltransferase/IMP cyclohydrolase [Porphyromonas sp. oral taxon 275]